MQGVSKIVCGTRKRKKAEWVTEEVVQLADKKEELFNKWQSVKSSEDHAAKQARDKYKAANRACLKATREQSGHLLVESQLTSRMRLD
jgi:hypothetical protein